MIREPNRCHKEEGRFVLAPSNAERRGVVSVAKAGDVVLGAICAVEQRDGRALMEYYRDDVVHDAPSLRAMDAEVIVCSLDGADPHA